MRVLPFVLGVLSTAPAFADIQPADGTWSGTWTYVGSTGCPPDMINQMLAAPEADRSYVQAITFPVPFDPVAIEAAGWSEFHWVRLSENVWQGSRSEVQTTPMGPVSSAVSFFLTVLSPDTMAQKVTGTVTMPPAIAAMAGMSGACQWTSHLDHARKG